MGTAGSWHESSKAERPARAGKGTNALDLLMADHKEVQKLFKEFKRLIKEKREEQDIERQAQLAQKICAALKIHTQIEEELFYPAARNVIDDKEIMDEALVEHAGAKDLIEQIEAMRPEDDLFEARLVVLGEYVNHHIDEEQDEMFPRLRRSDLDLEQLGKTLAERKEELQKELPAELFAAQGATQKPRRSGYLRQHHGSRS